MSTPQVSHPARPDAAVEPGPLVAWLSAISFLGYPLRTNITVTARLMMPQLGLTQVQMGDIFSAFQLPYALFQIPCGILADRFGSRSVLTIALLVWALSSVATGLVPAGLGVGATILALSAARGLLGVGEAATYPAGGLAISRHVPAGARGRAMSVFIAAATLGSTLAPIIISQAMVRVGWRATFHGAAAVALLLAFLWYIRAPRRGPRAGGALPVRRQLANTFALLRDRRLLLLSISYMCQAAVWFLFVFWFYIYLTDVRGFGMLRGGLFAAIPYLAAAVIGPLGGVVLDRLTARRGATFARRATAMFGLITAAICVLIGARLANPYLAIAALALSSGFINFVEAAYWTTATELGGDQAGAAGGVLNTVGNLGGVLSTSAVPRIVEAWGWIPAMVVFGGIAVAGALLWLTFRPERPAPA